MHKAITINNEVKNLESIIAKNETVHGFSNVKYASSETLYEWGFREVRLSQLNGNQTHKYPLLPEDYDEELDMFVVKAIDGPQYTAQYYYDLKKEESKQVFKEYSQLLNEACLLQLMKGENGTSLKELALKLESIKNRINRALDLYLQYDKINELQNFTFENEEAEQLKEEIENFS